MCRSSWGKSSGEDCMLDDEERKSVEFALETIWVSSFCSLKSGKEKTDGWWLFDDLNRGRTGSLKTREISIIRSQVEMNSSIK